MLAVIYKAITMVAIIFIGYALKRKGFFCRDHFSLLSRISLNITMPCVIISKFSEFTMDYSFLLLALLGLLLNLLCNLVGFLAGARRGRLQQAYNVINFSGYNIGSFTLPFAQTFLGAQGVVAVCLFDTGNSVMCTGGTYAIASSLAASGEKQGVGAFVKKLFSSVPLDTYLIMLAMACLNIPVPDIVTTFASTVGAANAFLAMLVIGVGFEWKMKKSEILDTMTNIFFRYGLAAVVALCFWFLLPFSLEVRQAMVLVAFSPLSALCPVFTMRIGGNEGLSSTVNSISIVISVAIMTCILVAFGM